MAEYVKVRIGRHHGEDVDLKIDHDTVSRVHAEAWYEPALKMVVVKDLGSVNGTEPAGQAELAGDTIRVGLEGSVVLGEVELSYDQLKASIDAKVAHLDQLTRAQQKEVDKKRFRSISLISLVVVAMLSVAGYFYYTLSANKQAVEASVDELSRALHEAEELMRNPPQIVVELNQEMVSGFLVYSDGTATDTRTGLMWSRCLLGQNWQSATKTCEGSPSTYKGDRTQGAATIANQAALLDKSDWRVPSRTELLTLVQGVESTVFQTVLPNDPMGFVWSSTPHREADSHWNVNFADGKVYWNNNEFLRYVRLVRDLN